MTYSKSEIREAFEWFSSLPPEYQAFFTRMFASIYLEEKVEPILRRFEDQLSKRLKRIANYKYD